MPLRQLYPKPQLAPPGHTVDTAKVDVIAVHGLNPRHKDDVTHAWDTWRSPAGPQGRLWLRDDLPQYLPEARIFLYEYNATAVFGKDKDTFVGKANELLEAIRIKRDEVESRPILFLGHSLGGLLVKQALLNAHNNPKYGPIKDATTGLAFFATPHNGGDWKLISLGAIVVKVAQATGFHKGDDILETLKTGSMFSDVMNEFFRQQLLKYDIISFWGAWDEAVPRESARFGMPGDRENIVKLNSDHSSICKFNLANQNDQDNFELVRANIKDIYKNALKKCGPTPAQDWDQGYKTFPSPPQPAAATSTTPRPPSGSTRFPPPPPSRGTTPEPGGAQRITGFMHAPTFPSEVKSRQAADHKNAGRWEQARTLEQQIFEDYQASVGVSHLSTLTAAYDIAHTTAELGYLADAERWADWVTQVGASALGPKHPVVLKASRMKGEALALKGQHSQAENAIATVLADQQELLGADHPDTLESERALGEVCHGMGRRQDAEARLRHRVEALTTRLGANHILVAAALIDLFLILLPPTAANPYEMMGSGSHQFEQTAMLANDLHGRLRSSLGPQHQITIRALRVCGQVKIIRGETTEASDMLRRALSGAEALLGRDHPDTMAIVSQIGILYSKQQDPFNPYNTTASAAAAAARPWFQRYVDWLEQRVGMAIPATREILGMLVLSYMAEQNYAEAEPYCERLVRSYQAQGIQSEEAAQANSMLQLCRMNMRLMGGRPGGGGGDLASMLGKFGFFNY